MKILGHEVIPSTVHGFCICNNDRIVEFPYSSTAYVNEDELMTCNHARIL